MVRLQTSEQHKTQLEYQMQGMLEYIAAVTGWIEISFTTCTQRFFLEPCPETRYTS